MNETGVQNVPGLQVGVVKLNPQAVTPPDDGFLSYDIYTSPTTGAPVVRDLTGVEHPLLVGLGGGGITKITVADSPYAVKDSDRIIEVDSSGGAVDVIGPAAGGPFGGRELEVVQLGADVVTLDGNGQTINGNPDATLTAPYQRIKVRWVEAFGAVAAQWVTI
jgi:hypothetical protein